MPRGLHAKLLICILLSIVGCSSGQKKNSSPAPAVNAAQGQYSSSTTLLQKFLEGVKIQRAVLDNGLRVLLVEEHSVPIVSYTTMVDVGSSYEQPGKTGLAHLFEHLMFKGTEKHPGTAYFQELEARGAQVNAYTTKEMTVFYAVVSSHALPLVVELEADRFLNLNLTEEKLLLEKPIVQEERRLRVESNFLTQALEDFQAKLYGSHPYGRPVIGSMLDLEQLRIEDCREFFKKYYAPANLLIVVAGDFDSEEILGKIRDQYGHWKNADADVAPFSKIPRNLRADAKEFTVPTPGPLPPSKTFVVKKPVEAETLLVGYRMPGFSHPDVPALTMLMWSLLGMGSSQANEVLVRRKQLAVGVSAELDLSILPSHMSITSQVRKGHTAQELLHALDGLIASVRRGQDSSLDAALGRVKNQIELSILEGARTPLGLSSWLAQGEFNYRDYTKVFELLEAYQKVNISDLYRVAKQYLDPKRRVVFIVKPGVTQTNKKAAQRKAKS